ncbi:MAG: sugar phosphate isomerase/epimerase family protein [Planctomycetaceae bacterium]
MARLQIAIATRYLNEPLRQALRSAAEMGAQGVQLDLRDELPAGELTETGRRQFRHHLNEMGLRVAAAHFPTRRTYFDEESLDARVAATRAAMDFAWDLGCTVLMVRWGKIPGDKASKEYRTLVEVIGDLAAYGNRVGVTLAAAPMHDSAEAMRELIGAIQTGPAGVDFDPAGFVLAGQKPHEALQTLLPFVAHVQARDAIREIGGSGLEVPLGRGETDWGLLLPVLEEAGYRRWISVVRTQGDDKRGDIRRAVQFLKNVLV